MPLSVVLVDDSLTFMESARTLLEQEGIRVVGTASTPEAAIECVRTAGPDVVLVDVHLGSVSGFDVARQLAPEPSTAPVVIMVSTAPREDIEPLLDDTPAAGFVPKVELAAAAIEAIVTSAREGAGDR
jgi:two-component system, NarL family, nitrate/nitrite response regulator NarL